MQFILRYVYNDGKFNKKEKLLWQVLQTLNPIDDPLLSPDNCVIAFIDYQEIQFDGVHSMDMQELMANTVTLATAAKDYNVPTIVSTVGVEAFDLAPTASEIMDVLGNPTPIDRTTLNSWEDEGFVAAVQATGKERLIIAGLWTEVCVAFPAISALKEG